MRPDSTSTSSEKAGVFLEESRVGANPENQSEIIQRYISKVQGTLESLPNYEIRCFADLVFETYLSQGTIFTCGNGGSSATASHFCGDLLKGMSLGDKPGIRAVCLSDNIPALMAYANDEHYDEVFVGPLRSFARKNDLLVGFSGSGNSENVVKAIEFGNQMGMKTVAVCGYDGGRIKDLATLSVHAEVKDMEVSEDVHLVIAHCVKNLLIRKLGAEL